MWTETDVRTGFKQECVIAPTLFSIFLSAVLHLLCERMPAGVKIRYRFDDIFNLSRLKTKTKTSIQTICQLQYADNNAIMAHSEEDLQCVMTAFHEAYTSLGLTLMRKRHKCCTSHAQMLSVEMSPSELMRRYWRM